MEHTGTIPPGTVDVGDLAALLDWPGPVLTVCLATPAAVERASMRNELHWGDHRDGVATASKAPTAALEAVDAVVADAHTAGEGVLVVADGSGRVHVEHSPVPPRQEWARWESLPSLVQVVDWRQHQPAYLVVLVDHAGADLMVSGWRVGDRVEHAGGTGGYPLERNAPGGWSQKRYQQRAVESWEANAGDVARATEELFAEVGAEVVVVAGDPRARQLLDDHLPAGVRERVETVPGSRAADGGGDRTAREVSRVVGTVTARRTVELLEEWRMHLGRGDRATDGVDATLGALRRAQVAVLLLHDHPGDERRAWWGDGPGLVAATAPELDGVGGGATGDGRLVDVALRAAAQTGAAVAVVPQHGGPTGGLGALLRWE